MKCKRIRKLLKIGKNSNINYEKENRHNDSSDDNSDDEEEECSDEEEGEWQWSNAKQKDVKVVKSDEFKEKKLEDCDLLIEEHACDNFRNVCLCNLINEDRKIAQNEVRVKAKNGKVNF